MWTVMYLYGNSFEYRIHSSGLVAQNLEKATEYYTAKFIDVQKNLTYVPPEVEFNLCDKKACSCNAGIIGGTDFTFFKNYASEVFDFINKNDLKRIPAHTLINFNILFEQVLFYNRLQNEKKEVVCLFDKIFDDNGYKYEEIADFTTVPFVTTYLHLIGPHKRNKTACDLMSRTLLKHYPDYYFSIAALFEKNQNEKGLSSVTEKHVCKEAGYSFVETVHQKLTSYSFQQPDISICLSEEKLAFIINAAEQYNMALTKIKEAFQTIPSQILINRDAHSINNFSFFYQIKERQIKTVLQKEFNLTITDTIYDWTLFKKEDSDVSGIADVTEESMVRIACLPDFLFPGYQEIPLEELDYYILCLAEIPNTLETILKELEACFNPEDIVNNYDNFFQLIMLKIRHLIVNKCLLIANSSSGFQPV